MAIFSLEKLSIVYHNQTTAVNIYNEDKWKKRYNQTKKIQSNQKECMKMTKGLKEYNLRYMQAGPSSTAYS